MPCPKCGGCGEVAVPPHLTELLQFVKANPKTTVEQAWRELGCKQTTPNAFSNRMTDLLHLNLVERTRVSKTYHYSAVKTKP